MRFLNSNERVELYRGKLPHWRQSRVIYFVTFRLYDSLPTAKLLELRQQRELWLKLNPAPWSRAQRKEYNERFNLRIQEWLDAGVGSCLLENPELKQVMDGVLKFFDRDRYELDEFCTMPNHVHVLVSPKSGWGRFRTWKVRLLCLEWSGNVAAAGCGSWKFSHLEGAPTDLTGTNRILAGLS
jgi:putative transposase